MGIPAKPILIKMYLSLSVLCSHLSSLTYYLLESGIRYSLKQINTHIPPNPPAQVFRIAESELMIAIR